METIKKIPVPIIAIFVLSFCLTWYLNDLRYKDQLNNKGAVIKLKDAIIESKNTQIAQIKKVIPTIKILIFDANGKVLRNIGAEKLIDSFKVTKQGIWDTIIVELHTKERLAHIPFIQSITDDYLISWDKPERIGGRTIKWTGHYAMYSEGATPPQFKMEIYQED